VIDVVAALFQLLLALGPADGAKRLHSAYPQLTVGAAREHYWASRLAGQEYGVDPDLLLGIAAHESNFAVRTVTHEPGHRVSCGVMTPVPQRRCSAQELTALGGYRSGAKHLRMWLDACRGSMWCALIAYGGGMRSVRRCRTGDVLSPAGHSVCALPYEFRSRALKAKS
jgi:soluble lytic murein transglycosylase-like protein